MGKENEALENTTTENKQGVRKIMENGRAKATREEIKYIEKTGNLTVDVYAGKEPKALGKNIPAMTPDNAYLLMQNAVLTGCHNKENGNCYVAVEAVKAEGSRLNLRESEEFQSVKQMFWDKERADGKDKSRYAEVTNAAKLESFISHNKEVSVEKQDAIVKALEEKAFKNLDNEATKTGLAFYDSAKDIAHVPNTGDRDQYLKDLAFAAASRETAKRTMEAKSPHPISFRREVRSSEQCLVKHLLAAELRREMGVGADIRNGLNRESASARKEVVNLLKRDEKALFNAARRARGIMQAMKREYLKDLVQDKAKEQAKAQDKGKGMND